MFRPHLSEEKPGCRHFWISVLLSLFLTDIVLFYSESLTLLNQPARTTYLDFRALPKAF